MSSKEQNSATLEKIYAAFAIGDWESWKDHIDENSVLIEAETLPYGGRFKGMDIVKGLQKIAEHWEDFDYQRHETYHGDNAIMVYGTMAATGKATGLRVTMPLAERWVLDGPIVREVTAIYGDTALCRMATLGEKIST